MTSERVIGGGYSEINNDLVRETVGFLPAGSFIFIPPMEQTNHYTSLIPPILCTWTDFELMVEQLDKNKLSQIGVVVCSVLTPTSLKEVLCFGVQSDRSSVEWNQGHNEEKPNK